MVYSHFLTPFLNLCVHRINFCCSPDFDCFLNTSYYFRSKDKSNCHSVFNISHMDDCRVSYCDNESHSFVIRCSIVLCNNSFKYKALLNIYINDLLIHKSTFRQQSNTTGLPSKIEISVLYGSHYFKTFSIANPPLYFVYFVLDFK